WIDPAAGRGTAADELGIEHPVLRDEHVLELDRLAAGAAEAVDEPVVLDGEVLLRHQHEAVVRRPTLFGDEDLKVLPVDEVDAAREAPVEHDPAVDIASAATL